MVTQKCVTTRFCPFCSKLTTHVLIVKTAIWGKKIVMNANFVKNGSINVVLWLKFSLIKILFRIRPYWLIVPNKIYFFKIIFFFFMRDRDRWTKFFQNFCTSNRTKSWVGLIKLNFLTDQLAIICTKVDIKSNLEFHDWWTL